MKKGNILLTKKLYYCAVLCFISFLVLSSSISATSFFIDKEYQQRLSLSFYDSYSIAPRIKDIHPNPANQYEEVFFLASFKIFDFTGEEIDDEDTCGDDDEYSGYGDSYISQLLWTSDIDGNLSNEISFSTDTLSPGTHKIHFKICSQDGEWTPPQIETLIVIENMPPEKPMITGSSRTEPGESVNYSFSSIDSEQDLYYFVIEWGDGTTYESENCNGEELVLSHIFDETGICTIKAKAVDEHGAESEWGEHQITLSKNIDYYNFFQNMIQRMFLTYFSFLYLHNF